jgi:glycine hydroxymethyltransferase
VRIGTAAITSRGFGEDDVRAVAQLIGRVLRNVDNEEVVEGVREEVRILTRDFPVPGLDG